MSHNRFQSLILTSFLHSEWDLSLPHPDLKTYRRKDGQRRHLTIFPPLRIGTKLTKCYSFPKGHLCFLRTNLITREVTRVSFKLCKNSWVFQYKVQGFQCALVELKIATTLKQGLFKKGLNYFFDNPSHTLVVNFKMSHVNVLLKSILLFILPKRKGEKLQKCCHSTRNISGERERRLCPIQIVRWRSLTIYFSLDKGQPFTMFRKIIQERFGILLNCCKVSSTPMVLEPRFEINRI